jgi:hypothetical protein
MLTLFDNLIDTEEETTAEPKPEPAECSCPMAGVVTDIDCLLHGERGKTTELVTIPERPATEPELIIEPGPPESV